MIVHFALFISLCLSPIGVGARVIAEEAPRTLQDSGSCSGNGLRFCFTSTCAGLYSCSERNICDDFACTPECQSNSDDCSDITTEEFCESWSDCFWTPQENSPPTGSFPTGPPPTGSNNANGAPTTVDPPDINDTTCPETELDLYIASCYNTTHYMEIAAGCENGNLVDSFQEIFSCVPDGVTVDYPLYCHDCKLLPGSSEKRVLCSDNPDSKTSCSAHEFGFCPQNPVSRSVVDRCINNTHFLYDDEQICEFGTSTTSAEIKGCAEISGAGTPYCIDCSGYGICAAEMKTCEELQELGFSCAVRFGIVPSLLVVIGLYAALVG